MIRIEKATISSAGIISRIAIDSFMDAVAPRYHPRGIAAFRIYACPDCITERMTLGNVFYMALDEAGIIGMSELIPALNHLSMLFVEVGRQRQGVGKTLVARMQNDILADTSAPPVITVDAAPNAVGAYECFSFRHNGGLREQNGIRFYPMSLSLIETLRDLQYSSRR